MRQKMGSAYSSGSSLHVCIHVCIVLTTSCWLHRRQEKGAEFLEKKAAARKAQEEKKTAAMEAREELKAAATEAREEKKAAAMEAREELKAAAMEA